MVTQPIIWKTKFHYPAYSNPPFVRILGQTKRVHILPFLIL